MPITRYATEEDLTTWGIQEKALRDIEPATIEAALEGASRTVDGYIQSQYTLPLETVTSDLKMHTAWLAAYALMSSVGYKPSGSDELLAEREAKARKWLEGVGSGRIQPSGMVGASTPGVGGQATAARPILVSSTSRGFMNRGDPNVSGGGFTGD